MSRSIKRGSLRQWDRRLLLSIPRGTTVLSNFLEIFDPTGDIADDGNPLEPKQRQFGEKILAKLPSLAANGRCDQMQVEST